MQANATQMALGRCAQHLADHPDVVVVEPPKPPPLPPPPPPKWWLDPWGLAASGAGVVAIGVGAGFIAAAYSARGDAQTATTLAAVDERWSAATSRRTLGVVALGAGSILVAAGVYRFLTLKRAADRRDVVVSVTPGMVRRGGDLLGARRGLAVLAFAATASACLGQSDFRCATNAQCGDVASGAACEANGRCSVPDAACALSARRYVQHAGSDSGACVARSCETNPVAALAAGGAHACLRRLDGTVSCWGRNDDGQIGDGTRTPRALATAVAGLDDAISIAPAIGTRARCAWAARSCAGAPTTRARSATAAARDA